MFGGDGGIVRICLNSSLNFTNEHVRNEIGSKFSAENAIPFKAKHTIDVTVMACTFRYVLLCIFHFA